MTSIDSILLIIKIVLGIVIVAVGVGLALWFFNKDKKPTTADNDKKNKKVIDPNVAKENIKNFLPYEAIEDDMIIMDMGEKFVMLVEAEGINYHLMSDAEKDAIEGGFIQFLNSIRFPIQIYVQTTAVNLDSSLDHYKDRLKAMEDNLINRARNLQALIKQGNTPVEKLDMLQLEVRGLQNVYTYTQDLIANIENITLNRWILKKHYYIAVSYHISEMGVINKFSPKEMHDFARSELETRAQSIVQGLASSGVTGNIVDTNGLMQIMYSALNRDDANVYNFAKAKEAEFDALFSTTEKAYEESKKSEGSIINRDLFKFDY